MKVQEFLMCCFNTADSHRGLVTLALLSTYLSGKNKRARSNKEKAINSNALMGLIWQRNLSFPSCPHQQTYRICSMSWELKPFHSNTCCFHFLVAVGVAYHKRAEGTALPTKLGLFHHAALSLHALPDFPFRGLLPLLTGRQWQRFDGGDSSVWKFPSWCSLMETWPLHSVHFCVVWMPEKLWSYRVCVFVVPACSLHILRRKFMHTQISFQLSNPAPNHERNPSPIVSLWNGRP